MTGFPQVESGGQLLVFFLSAIPGAFLGILFDCFAAVRMVIKHSRAAVFFEDVLCWIVFTFAYFCFLLAECYGQVRLYSLLGCVGGFVLWRMFVSRKFVKIISLPFRALKHIINRLNERVIILVTAKIEGIISRITKFISAKIKKIRKDIKTGRNKHKKGKKTLANTP